MRTQVSVGRIAGWALLAAASAGGPRAETVGAGASTSAPAIRAEDLRRDVQFLADDASGGRLTGTEGLRRAAEYIRAAFERAGLVPAPGLDGYFQPFTFTSGVRQVAGANRLAGHAGDKPTVFEPGKDFLPLTFSGNGTAEGEVVFIGYGLVEPVDKGYDSYQGLDVRGKIVLCLRDLPEDVSAERRQELALYAGDRYKAKLAADRGAAGVIFVVGPGSPGGGELIPFRESDRSSAIAVPAVSVTQAVADRLLGPSGKSVQQLQAALDPGTLDPHAAAPRGIPVRLGVGLERLKGTCRNVLGYLPPAPGVEQVVIVGAHYDHIGSGEGLGSLARQGEKGQIHNGADDNASGTAVVLELAAALAGEYAGAGDRPRRGLLFAAWSGEELGLVGSEFFVNNPPLPLERVAAYINFDMVGHLRQDRLIVKAVGSSSVWRGLLERHNAAAGFDLRPLDDPYLPTDLTSFYPRQVPGLDFFTDIHEHYNRPTDDAATLDYEGMQRIAEFAARLIRDVADPERKIDYVRVQRAAAPSGGMRRRVYTGMVPDFAGSEGQGMLLSDVQPGGPADKAGIRGGDRVVEFAGRPITSLQDYSDALAGAKVGQTVAIVVIRDGVRISLEITPEARK
jgi:hypothetical protein